MANNLGNNSNHHLGHMIRECMLRKPETICQIDAATRKQETNASVLSRSIRLACCLRDLGLRSGDVLALGGNKHLDLHIPLYAGLFNGLQVVGVDPFFKFDEIKLLFKQTEPKMAFCEYEMLDDYVRAAEELGLDMKVVTFHKGESNMTELIETNDEKAVNDFELAEFDMDKVYIWLVSTGGTTGRAKVAAFKHQPMLQKTLAYIRMLGEDKKEDTPNRPALNLSPIQWISGLFNAVGMPLMNQCIVQTSAPVTPEHVIDIINEYKPVTMLSSPYLLTSILKNLKKCDFTCFNDIMITGSKIHKKLLTDLRALLREGAVVLEGYGQVENIGPVLKPNSGNPLGSCGRPIPIYQIKLVDPDGNEITEPNIPGEVWTKGGPRFTEYYNNPKETAGAFTEDGWFKTGDVLYRDEEDNYYFVERKKMLIKYRNNHVLPAELEEVILSHDGVLDVCVTSIPHEEDGEWPVACVLRQVGADVTAQEIKDLVANKLSETKQLRGGVIFLEKFPLTSIGKIAKAELAQIALKACRE